MKRKRRTINPHFKPIAVDWKLVLDRAKAGKEALEITFRGELNGFSNNTLSLPVMLGAGKCYPRKIGTLKKRNESKGVTQEVPFSLIPEDDERELTRWEKIINNLIEEVGKTVSRFLASLKKGETEISGSVIIPAKILRIPKMITVQEVSLEGLQADGQLPMDLKGFKKM